jgi:hypothetical protein
VKDTGCIAWYEARKRGSIPQIAWLSGKELSLIRMTN